MYVIKKDGTKEEFNVEKVVNAVNKSAARILYKFPKMRRSISAGLRRRARNLSGKRALIFRTCTTSRRGRWRR